MANEVLPFFLERVLVVFHPLQKLLLFTDHIEHRLCLQDSLEALPSLLCLSPHGFPESWRCSAGRMGHRDCPHDLSHGLQNRWGKRGLPITSQFLGQASNGWPVVLRFCTPGISST